MVGDEEELLQVLEEAFVNDKKFSLDHLQQLEEKQKLEEAAAYVHSFKGAARQIAAEKAAFTGQELEDVLRGKKTGDLNKLNTAFSVEMEKAVSEIKEDMER